MKHHARRLLALASIALLGACADDRPTAATERSIAPTRTIVAGCTAYSFTDLVNLVNTVYAPGSPNANAVLGKLNNLQHQLNLGAIPTAHERAFDIADFTVTKYREGAILAAEDDVIALVNGVLCFAGLGPYFSTIDNAWVVYPSDLPQTFVSTDGWAGMTLPAYPVSEPTVVSITRLADTPSPLVTDLDKYPLNYDFGKSSATNAPFTQDVTVAVCPASGVDPSVRARLKLGHQDAVDGFEVLPPVPADFIDCTGAPSLPSSLLAASDLAATNLSADDSTAVVLALAVGAPGVGGLTDSFSPLAPVDPLISGRGGVGGTADSFRPGTTFLNTLTCGSVEAPIGSAIAATCRPSMTFSTFLGTPLDGIPVTYAVEQGGGQVALEGLVSCGSFASQFSALTPSTGIVRSCWTLGLTPGTNTLVATAANGGDAVPGTSFAYEGADGTTSSATVVRFTATANPPSALAFTSQPSSVVAGSTFGATVHVLDRNGQLVAGYDGPVSIGLTSGAFTMGSTTTVSAVAGVASFTNLSITSAATGYSLVATATLNGQLVTETGSAFSVVPGAPVTIVKLAGDGQVAPAGTAVPIAPRVRVTDTWGNPVPALDVTFEAQNNSAGITGGAQVTSAAGEAAVGSWTLLDGPNSLIAYVTGNPLVFTTFTATGTSTLTVVNSCPLGGSGDPLQYPFVIPGSSRDITQVELYLASNGAANTPKTYVIALDARLNSFGNPVIATSQVAVTLTGRTSEALPTVFRFATPIVARSNDKVAFAFRVVSNPDAATLSYNTGPCGLGGCKAPRGCSATQQSGLTPLPLGSTRRQSVALRVLGR